MVEIEQRRHRVRVYELAKDLGVSTKDLMSQATRLGHFVKSPSSVLPEPAVRRLRYVVAAQIESGELQPQSPGQAPSPTVSTWTPPRAPRPAPWRTSGKLSSGVIAMLDGVVLPGDHPWSRVERPGREEVARAESLLLEWSGQLFEPAEAVAWLRQHKIPAQLARELHNAGLTPEMATQRVWYGKVSPGHPTLANRVLRGDFTAKEARAEYDRAFPAEK